jgi:hypothetical protein
MALLVVARGGGKGGGGCSSRAGARTDAAAEMEPTGQDIHVKLRLVNQRRGLILDLSWLPHGKYRFFV